MRLKYAHHTGASTLFRSLITSQQPQRETLSSNSVDDDNVSNNYSNNNNTPHDRHLGVNKNDRYTSNNVTT